MSILDKWRRPRWQHPDAAVRLKALADDVIDGGDCQTLAIEDPDPAVREHAIKRLESVDRLLDVLGAQPGARSAVAARLTELLLSVTSASLGQRLDAAVAVIAATTDADRLARDATDSAIRSATVAVATDPSTLRHCALRDRVVDVRVQAVNAIDDEAMLDEIARAAKGNDKTVARLAATRLADLRTRRERSAERDALLDRLAALAAADELDVDALQRLRAQWQPLADDASTAQRARHADLEPRLDARLATWRAAEQADRAQRAEREQLLARLRTLAAGLGDSAADATRAAFGALRPVGLLGRTPGRQAR
ncbi:MAG: hypothetical protein QNJ91_12705, partial [Gammaproteobacteria bacterium]|nr:hypothetical protein [Gammaproteobacteria bacterium]